MLFLAVFCGFLAEYQLEHKIEKDREKQFIISMVKELEADSLQVHQVMTDSVRKYMFDTLLRKLYSSTINEADTRYIYILKKKYLHLFWAMKFSNNTLSQLKNGGNMRLIRNRNVVDSLNMLDNYIASIEMGRMYYENKREATMAVSAKIFNDGYFRKNSVYQNPEYVLINPETVAFMTKDRNLILEFANLLSLQITQFIWYHISLNNYEKLVSRLIPYLKKEYHLE